MNETADLYGIEGWVAPIERSLLSHPEGCGLTVICSETGASVATIIRVMGWLERVGRAEAFGDPRRDPLRYRPVTSCSEGEKR